MNIKLIGCNWTITNILAFYISSCLFNPIGWKVIHTIIGLPYIVYALIFYYDRLF